MWEAVRRSSPVSPTAAAAPPPPSAPAPPPPPPPPRLLPGAPSPAGLDPSTALAPPSRSVLLSYKLLDGEAARPALVFLHGLFGSKTNFGSVAKALAQQTGRRVSFRERRGPAEEGPVSLSRPGEGMEAAGHTGA